MSALSGLTSNITVGATYNVTLPTYSDGATAALQTDINGRLLTRTVLSIDDRTSLDVNYGTPTAATLRVAAMLGVGATAVSTSNPVPVGGTIAAGAADSGNPIKVGGVYNTALPTYTNGQRGDIQLDANGRQFVVATGNVAAGAADSGNPVKMGGVFNTALPTYTNGQRGDLQIDAKGRQIVAMFNTSGNEIDYNFGTPGAATIRTAAMLGVGLAAVSNANPVPTRTSDGTNASYMVNLAASRTNLSTGNALPVTFSAILGWDGANHGEAAIDTNGNLKMVGSVAAGAADTGNPVKVGGIYKVTPPTLTDGQRGDLQLDSLGKVITKSFLYNSVTGNAFQAGTGAAGADSQNVSATIFQGGLVLSASNTIPTKQFGGLGGTYAQSTGLTTVVTETAPSNAIGFILFAKEDNPADIRFCIGATATASNGIQLQPGRDTGFIPCGANISLCSESGTNGYMLQWIT